MKAIAKSSAAGGRLCAMLRELLALGSMEIAVNHIRMSQETNAHCWPADMVSCLRGGCKKEIKPKFTVFQKVSSFRAH